MRSSDHALVIKTAPVWFASAWSASTEVCKEPLRQRPSPAHIQGSPAEIKTILGLRKFCTVKLAACNTPCPGPNAQNEKTMTAVRLVVPWHRRKSPHNHSHRFYSTLLNKERGVFCLKCRKAALPRDSLIEAQLPTLKAIGECFSYKVDRSRDN